jgi:penicillin-binding protein 2
MLGALALAVRLFDLQVLGVRDYTLQSERNRVRREWVGAPRGLIVDRAGVVLADSRPSFTVLAVPRQVLKDERCLQRLSETLAMPIEDIRTRLSSGARHLPRVVQRDVGFEQVSRISEREEEFPGVSVGVTNVRSYPEGKLAAHVIGHVGEISEQEIANQRDRGYRAGDFVGRTGIERVYESELRGQDGERYLEVDAVGRVVGRFAGREPILPLPGRTLELYVDARLQAAAESLLADRRGTVCVMDVETGGMLVLASSPRFDPNAFATGIRSADWRVLNGDPDLPMLNRAVQAVYSPGSTFKAVSFVLCLEKGVFGLRQFAPKGCFGGYRFGTRWYGCWDPAGHGSVDLEGAVVRSCDTYFYQVAERVRVDDLAQVAFRAGLGQPTGIDLPQELVGNVPTSEWLDRRYGVKKWTQGLVLNHIIGQGEYLTTPLQMVRMVASIATDGELLAPRLARSVEEPDGSTTLFPIHITGEWEMTEWTRHSLQAALREVVHGERGTARSCRIPGHLIAGKTGTAENSHGAPHSWFVGYAPADAPEIAFSVIVEGGGHGSDVAVPIAKKLLQTYWHVEGAT